MLHDQKVGAQQHLIAMGGSELEYRDEAQTWNRGIETTKFSERAMFKH